MKPDQGSSPSAPGGRRLRRATNAARVASRFARLPAKRAAFGLAMQKFADRNGSFDRAVWKAAFEADEPSTILDVHSLTGVFEDLMNNLTEMMLTAAHERHLPVVNSVGKPKAPELYDAVTADGGLTRAQANVLKDLNWVRNQLQHSSPVITADEAYEGIVRLQRSLVPVLRSYVNWLDANGLSQLLGSH